MARDYDFKELENLQLTIVGSLMDGDIDYAKRLSGEFFKKADYPMTPQNLTTLFDQRHIQGVPELLDYTIQSRREQPTAKAFISDDLDVSMIYLN